MQLIKAVEAFLERMEALDKNESHVLLRSADDHHTGTLQRALEAWPGDYVEAVHECLTRSESAMSAADTHEAVYALFEQLGFDLTVPTCESCGVETNELAEQDGKQECAECSDKARRTRT